MLAFTVPVHPVSSVQPDDQVLSFFSLQPVFSIYCFAYSADNKFIRTDNIIKNIQKKDNGYCQKTAIFIILPQFLVGNRCTFHFKERINKSCRIEFL